MNMSDPIKALMLLFKHKLELIDNQTDTICPEYCVYPLH